MKAFFAVLNDFFFVFVFCCYCYFILLCKVLSVMYTEVCIATFHSNELFRVARLGGTVSFHLRKGSVHVLRVIIEIIANPVVLYVILLLMILLRDTVIMLHNFGQTFESEDKVLVLPCKQKLGIFPILSHDTLRNELKL